MRRRRSSKRYSRYAEWTRDMYIVILLLLLQDKNFTVELETSFEVRRLRKEGRRESIVERFIVI